MKTLAYFFLSIISLFSFQNSTMAQVQLTTAFSDNLEKMRLEVELPVEESYRRKFARKSDFFKSDYTIRSRKGKVEIQYMLIPDTMQTIIPHIHASIIASTLTTNDESFSTMVIHPIIDEELSKNFNADWGSVVYFQPKQSFTKYKYGKLLSLYKEDRGMVYVLFLFEKEKEEELDWLYAAAKFEK